MKSEIVLSLDQALRVSGYGVFVDNSLVAYGTFEIDSDGTIGERLKEFIRHIDMLYGEYEFDHLVFEDIQYQNNIETYKKLAFVQAALYLWCNEAGVQYTVLGPSEWRSKLKEKFGRTRKEQKEHAMDFVKRYSGKDVTSDEADAICIGLAYLRDKYEISEEMMAEYGIPCERRKGNSD